VSFTGPELRGYHERVILFDKEIQTEVKKSFEISPALLCRTIVEDGAYQNRLGSDVSN
jgi:hypothetical protein